MELASPRDVPLRLSTRLSVSIGQILLVVATMFALGYVLGFCTTIEVWH